MQFIASYARKIFVCGLKLSGSAGQAAENCVFTRFPEAKKVFGRRFRDGILNQKRYVLGMKEDKLKRFETKSTEYLREEGVYGDVEASAMKQVIASALAQRMERLDMSVSELAQSLGTSRAAVNRILDPLNTALTLTTLARAAAALGCRVRIEVVNSK
ncbi:MAG TPA: XRE family transcriptional regulator [Lacunisphaera sp.]